MQQRQPRLLRERTKATVYGIHNKAIRDFCAIVGRTCLAGVTSVCPVKICPALSNFLSNVIQFKFRGAGFAVELIKQKVESAIENGELRREDVKEIPGDFEKIKLYIDWQKFHEAVVAWARENKARNAWKLGPKNFLRCLYDLGIPGGKCFDLEWEQDGSLRNQ